MSLKYEELSEGMVLPEVKKGPFTRKQLIDYASASGDYNKLHYDDSFAQKMGLKGTIAHGMLVMATVGSYITDWAKGGIIKNYKISFRGMTNEDDTLAITGVITKKYEEGSEKLIQINVQSETQTGVITTQGSALIVF